MIKKMLAAAVLAAFTLGAQAAVVTASVLANQDSSTFLDLLRFAPASSTPGVVRGGTIYTGPADSSIAAIPQDTANGIVTSGTWLGVGPASGDLATVYLGAGTSFVSFLWGSPDTYNSLLVTTTGGSQFFVASDFSPFVVTGNQDYASYIGFTADSGLLITSLTFSSTSNAFEASNFSITTPIPEPASYALMLAGLAALGFVSRRRKA